MTLEEEGAYWNFVARRRMYEREGVTTCGTCGEKPRPAPVFRKTMSCGHPWTALVWTRDQ